VGDRVRESAGPLLLNKSRICCTINSIATGMKKKMKIEYIILFWWDSNPLTNYFKTFLHPNTHLDLKPELFKILPNTMKSTKHKSMILYTRTCQSIHQLDFVDNFHECSSKTYPHHILIIRFV
jgi:hypothetical protein